MEPVAEEFITSAGHSHEIPGIIYPWMMEPIVETNIIFSALWNQKNRFWNWVTNYLGCGVEEKLHVHT